MYQGYKFGEGAGAMHVMRGRGCTSALTLCYYTVCCCISPVTLTVYWYLVCAGMQARRRVRGGACGGFRQVAARSWYG